MDITQVLILLAVAAVIGLLGQIIAGGKIGGFFASIIVGFGGAYLGMWLAAKFHLPRILPLTVGEKVYPLVWSVGGAVILVAIIRIITGKKR